MENNNFLEEEKKTIEFVKLYSEKSGYKLNPSQEEVDLIVKGLTNNKIKYGFRYCPCRILEHDKIKDQPKICPCKWHKDEIEQDGHCHCRLYFKV
jgi:ferredoxin-thioredoxin reductase catalytic chain